MSSVDGNTLKGVIRDNDDWKARIVTDEFRSSRGLGVKFEGEHRTINHGVGEYSRGDIHESTTESYFSLLKRVEIGSFHHVSKQHLGRYCDELSFRLNSQKISDMDRMSAALQAVAGQRIHYCLN